MYCMEHPLDQVSEVCSVMPCELEWCQLKRKSWAFWSIKHNNELEYQRTIFPIISNLVKWTSVSTSELGKLMIKSVIAEISSQHICLFQFWAPIKINGSTFLSIADQPFVFIKELDKSLSSYRRLCLDMLIPIDNYNYKVALLGPPGRVYRRGLPEYNPDVQSYSPAEFPLRESATRLGICSYYAFPVFNLHDQRYFGVFEILSTKPSLRLPQLIKSLNFKSVGLYTICNSRDILFGLSKPVHDRLDEIVIGFYEILERHGIPFAQIWIPYSQSGSLKVLYRAAASIYKRSSSMHHEFEYVSKVCFIEPGKALVGKAFASQGSYFCKDVALLSIKEYPLVPSARKARFTQSFAICLQSKCTNNFVCVVEYFLPPNEMVVRDTKTFLNMLLSTMKEQLPGFIVASGKELGQRMLVEVVKVSPTDKLDSFEIGQLQKEKGTNCLGHKRSPARGVPRDSLVTLKVTYRGDIIKFQLSVSSTRVELEEEVKKRFKISLQRFSIKYKDEDDDWILITTDSDLSYGMHSLRLLGRTTMRLLVTPKADT